MPIAPGLPLPFAAVLDPGRGASLPLAEVVSSAPHLILVCRSDCTATDIAAAVLPRFAGIPGLRLVALSQDAEPDALAAARRWGWSGDVRIVLDAAPWEASNALGVAVTPTWLLVGGDGRVAATAEGWSRDEVNALAARAAALLDEPAQAVARPDLPEPRWRPG